MEDALVKVQEVFGESVSRYVRVALLYFSRKADEDLKEVESKYVAEKHDGEGYPQTEFTSIAGDESRIGLAKTASVEVLSLDGGLGEKLRRGDWKNWLFSKKLISEKEVVLDELVLQKGRLQRRILSVPEHDHPVGGQLMGSRPETFGRASRELVRAGYDVVDVNFGCPVNKVLGRRRGGWLLQDSDTALAMVDSVLQSVQGDAPVTVKMRRGSDDSPWWSGPSWSSGSSDSSSSWSSSDFGGGFSGGGGDSGGGGASGSW